MESCVHLSVVELHPDLAHAGPLHLGSNRKAEPGILFGRADIFRFFGILYLFHRLHLAHLRLCPPVLQIKKSLQCLAHSFRCDQTDLAVQVVVNKVAVLAAPAQKALLLHEE